MIAICRGDSLRESREKRYALRRILVARLQSAYRRVPRRARFEGHRQFAEEWETYARDGRLGLVHRALAVGPAVAAEAGEGWRSSLLLSLAADCLEPRTGRRPEPEDAGVPTVMQSASESAGAHAVSALDSPNGAVPDVHPQNHTGRSADLQADLFPPQLIPQPV